MLQKLDHQISECYRHAEHCRHSAEATTDVGAQRDFFDLEQRWIGLAHSYELSERASIFTAFLNRR